METLIKILQLILAGSVFFVWTFRFHNVIKEFEQFGLSIVTRSLVGASKIALATLLVAGIWYPSLVLVPAIGMGLFMMGAQYFHNKAGNPMMQRLPSLILLILSIVIAYSVF